MIGDEIEVSVLSVVGDRVRIGIQAPMRVPVFRTEIYVEIHKPESANEAVTAARGGAIGAAVKGIVSGRT
jgi:carbon storage regulator